MPEFSNQDLYLRIISQMMQTQQQKQQKKKRICDICICTEMQSVLPGPHRFPGLIEISSVRKPSDLISLSQPCLKQQTHTTTVLGGCFQSERSLSKYVNDLPGALSAQWVPLDTVWVVISLFPFPTAEFLQENLNCK